MTPAKRLTDLRPLRTSRPFREIWVASLLTGLAGQIAAVAVLAQVWELTRSPVWTGAIGLAQGIPTLLFGVIGGGLADRCDRRTIILAATAAQFVAALGLTLQAFTGSSSPWLVLGLLAAQAAAAACASPARRTLPVRLLPRDQVGAGLALQQIGFQTAMLAGPALGGLLVAWSLPAGFFAQALMLPIALVAALRMPSIAPDRAPGRPITPGGWLHPVRQPVIRGVLLTDVVTMSLSMPIALFPMINALRFDSDPRTLGLFLSAIAAGGLLAGAFSGQVTRLPRPGWVQLVCAITWGLALIGFGLAPGAWLALGCLVAAGAADTVGVVTRASTVQLETPDGLRGRVSAVDHVIGVAGPELGNMRGGLLAALVGAPAALVIGGSSAIVAVALVGAAHPQMRAYRGSASARERETAGPH